MDDYNPTTINGLIRELLGVFECRSYIGYTATPFANIFIPPHIDDEKYGTDLFPRDFIYRSPRPDAVPANIITPRHIFAELRPHFAGCRNIVFFPNRLKLTFNDGITIANMVLNLFFKIFQNLLFNLILLANEADNMD